MSYDARIILGGRSPDIVNALAVSEQGRQQRLDNQNQNAMRDMLKTQGAGIMAGDQQALNALAQFDPSAALGIQTQRQDMAYNDKRLSVLGEQEKRAAAEYAAGLSAEQRAAEAAQLEGTIKQALAAPTPQAFDAMMIEMGRQDMVGQFDNRQALAAPFMEIADILKMTAGPEPEKPADEYGRYVAEETAAGRVPLGRIDYAQALKGNGVTQTIKNPDGSETTIQIGGKSGAGSPGTTIGQVYNPNEIASVVTMIDEIASDPALNKVVGPLEGGGGNNIDDLGMVQRGYYGGDGTALIERIGQLQSNAWLSARQMLKGGGAITDYESRKAEAAVARLSRAKSEDEFKQALKDLRDAITEGEANLRKAQGQTAPTGQPAPPPGGDMSDEDLLRMYGGE